MSTTELVRHIASGAEPDDLSSATKLLFGFTRDFTGNSSFDAVWGATRAAVRRELASSTEREVAASLLKVAYQRGGFCLWLLLRSPCDPATARRLRAHRTLMDVCCSPPPWPEASPSARW